MSSVRDRRPDANPLAALEADPAVAEARRLAHAGDEETLADMLELVAIPAPPFGEEERGRRLAERFREIGLLDVVTDAVGNVLGRLPGPASGEASPVLLAAHLDTVFPEETPIRVRREGGRILAPGISDNCRGLAAMLAVGRAMTGAALAPARPVVLVGTVGEEGVGDLRGVKHLFREGAPWRRAEAFISLDGTGLRRIVSRAIASRRLRVVIRGPGGHSWADYGLANPIHALALTAAEIARTSVPHRPRTSLTIGRIGGGTSVNAIPDEAWCEIDIRSEGPAPIDTLEARIRDALSSALSEADAHRRRGTPVLEPDVELIGDRPGGETPADSPLLATARAATLLVGESTELVGSSTDANLPIALGIPAIAMGAGGEAGGTHTTEEWYSNEKGPEGVERALLTVLGVAGLAGAG